MFEKKYIIIIAIVVCLFILYYFYDELASIKKMFMPTYQKTMSLEARMAKLETQTANMQNKKDQTKKIDTPPLSITYQSDMIKNGVLSAKYIDLSETEAKELLKNIEQNRSKQNNNPMQPNMPLGRIPQGEFSETKNTTSNKNITNPKNNSLGFDESETINIKIADLIKKNVGDQIKTESPTAEYQKIYDSLNVTNVGSDEVFNNDDIDEEMAKDISESIQYADIPSENTISDIPPKNKQSNKSRTTKKKKKISAKHNR